MASKPVDECTVVVVDDDPAIRQLLRLVFHREHFRVVGEAVSGHEAMALARIHQPDFIILDYLMPTLNGDSTANALRLLTPRSRIVAFSAALDKKPNWADAFLNKDRIAEIGPLLEDLAAQNA